MKIETFDQNNNQQDRSLNDSPSLKSYVLSLLERLYFPFFDVLPLTLKSKIGTKVDKNIKKQKWATGQDCPFMIDFDQIVATVAGGASIF